jgi:DNA repair protein RecO (recombination protein O)
MEERATGIILRTRPLTETSLIVHWLTLEHGRIATVARGARRSRSPLRGKLDLYYGAEFSFVPGRRSDLHLLREVTLRRTHAALREDWQKLEQAAYGAALLEQATETDTPVPELYALFAAYLEHLCSHPARPEWVLAFELKALRELGLEPDPYESKHSEGTRVLLRKLTEEDWPWLARLRASTAQVRELTQFLHGFLIYHLERLPRGRAEALAV